MQLSMIDGTRLRAANGSVSGGLFSVELDFGAVFDGTALYLAVAVRPASSYPPHHH
jgi:hypothetical protein